jgi:putative methionine-R-sulfoxide reductase with GAF domain
MTGAEQFSWQRQLQQTEGVLDVDSTHPDRFSEQDEAGLNALAKVFLSSID